MCRKTSTATNLKSFLILSLSLCVCVLYIYLFIYLFTIFLSLFSLFFSNSISFHTQKGGTNLTNVHVLATDGCEEGQAWGGAFGSVF